MLRLAIVLPIYFLCDYLVRQTQAYADFAAWMSADFKDHGLWHIGFYAAALVFAAVDAAFVHYKQMPRASAWGAVGLRIYWVFLVGVIVASGFQLFSFFTEQPLSVGIVLMPLYFALAEALYLAIELLLARFGPAPKA